MNLLQASAVSMLSDIYGDDTEQIIGQIKAAFRANDDVLRVMAGYCHLMADVPREDLERVEGRREMFRFIMSLIESDPLKVARYLHGENID